MKTAIIERMVKHFKAHNDKISLDVLKFSLARPVYRAEYNEELTLTGFTAKKNALISKCRDYGTIILYGAGMEGVIYFAELQKSGVKIAAFMDTFKTGTYCGKPIITMEEYKEKFADTVIVITPKLPKHEIKYALESKGIRNILYFEFDSQFTDMNVVFPDAEKLFCASGKEQYFSLAEMSWGGGEVFVDCGAFDGGSTLDFIKHCKNRGVSYRKIFVFEPDPINVLVCGDTLSQSRNITLFNAGVGNYDGTAKFEMQGGMSRVVGDEGVEEVRIVTLDNTLRGERVTFIKMDIEGSELAALQGAAEIIRTQRPKLAICVYHKDEDIWEIPEYIWSLNPNYRFFLRHYSMGLTDTVLYALPQ